MHTLSDFPWRASRTTFSFIYTYAVIPSPNLLDQAVPIWDKVATDNGLMGVGGAGYKVVMPVDSIPDTLDNCIRTGFDPILDSQGPGPRLCWFASDLGSISIEQSTELISMQVSSLLRLWDNGAGSLTFNLQSTSPLDPSQVFTILDLVRIDPLCSRRILLQEGLLHQAQPITCYKLFQDVLASFLTPLYENHLLEASSTTASESDPILESTYQCPYIVTRIDLLEADRSPPWITKKKRITEYQKYIAAILLRPAIWSFYLSENDRAFTSFQIPADVIPRGETQFLGEDYFWDKRGLVLFHPRSSIFVSCLPSQLTSLANMTWYSLIDILECLRSRWYLYIDLSSHLDNLLKFNNREDLISRIITQRSRLIRSLNYSLPYSQTASHLVELARAAEEGFLIDDLYEQTIRKFQSINWLYSDIVERQRREFLKELE